VLAQVKHALVGLVGSGVDAGSTGSRRTRAEWMGEAGTSGRVVA
jgi:hypothetical protein